MGKAELGAYSQQAVVSLFLSLLLHPHGDACAPDVCQHAPCVGVLVCVCGWLTSAARS